MTMTFSFRVNLQKSKKLFDYITGSMLYVCLSVCLLIVFHADFPKLTMILLHTGMSTVYWKIYQLVHTGIVFYVLKMPGCMIYDFNVHEY